MKRAVVYLLIAVVVAVGSALQAQACGDKSAPRNSGSSSFTGERMGKFLAGLDLTDQQKAQVQALMQKQRDAFKSGDKEQIKAAMAAFRQELEGILTDAQKAKLAELKGWFAGKAGEWKGRFGGRGGCHKKSS
jgi:Spy/CpxP family protein refolding chaperone